jgi:hypothetical protein
MVSDILLDSKSISRGYFRKEEVAALIDRNSRSRRYTGEIFSLVVLELWHRAFVDSREGLYATALHDHRSAVAHLALPTPAVNVGGHADNPAIA